eukprot:1745285-Amphidinium_carterae.1
MTATTEQMQALVPEMQRMSAYRRLSKLRLMLEHEFSKPSKPQVRPRTRRQRHRGRKYLQEVMPQGWWTQGPLEDHASSRVFAKTWKDWNFHSKAFSCGANPDASAALDTAGISDQTIVLANLPPRERELSRQVYLALCLLVSGVAMTKLQSVESHMHWLRSVEASSEDQQHGQAR